MKVLSLFDGISCGRVALERCGIPVEKYYASEIDKNAIQITQKNYPDTIQLGDVTQIDFTQFKDIDLLIGGSPCQGFSISGKKLNFDDPRSKLFFEFVKSLQIIQPRYFLLENVVMKQEWQDIISEYLGVKPIKINSALVSAQQRKRLYWTNIPFVSVIPDKHIYLKDILEDGVPITDKAYCLKVSGSLGLTLNGFEHYLKYKKDNFVFKNKPVRIGHFNSGGQGDRVYTINGKSITLSALGGGRGALTGLYYVGELEKYEHIIVDPNKIKENIRKLTPLECERLQTLPDNYTEGISPRQRYKALGNGWTVDVICLFFKNLKGGVL